MKLILMGPQGSGKGTQAKLITKEYNWPHISAGDLLRENIKNETNLGKKAKTFMNDGKLVPNELILDLINERLSRKDCDDGFILDGYPRNSDQANALDDITNIDLALEIFISDEEAVKRISGRRSCSCGEVYHIVFNPPEKEGICNKCKSKLFVRDDDKEEAIKTRLKIYHESTAPLKEKYEHVYRKIDGTKLIDDVFEDVKTVIAEIIKKYTK